MKILHVASFRGNIGDTINHCGFEKQFRRYVRKDAEFIREEIRDYYKIRNLKKFDWEFVQYANKFDLVVIGGGNFLSPWLESSNNGTTFDISIENLKKISTPILFNAVGCESTLGYNAKTISGIRDFFDYILLSNDSRKYFVTVRNDGSYDFIKNIIGKKYSNAVYEIPDNGFFCPVNEKDKCDYTGKTIALSVAEDRLKSKLDQQQYRNFINTIKTIILYFARKSYKIIFIPHTYNDLFFLTDLYRVLDDEIIRNNISVSSLKTNSDNGGEVIKPYLNCDLAIVMRFHASIACILSNKPFVTLTLDKRLLELFNNLNLKNIINMNFDYEVDDVFKKMQSSFSDYRKILEYLEEVSSNVYTKISEWLCTKAYL